MHQAIKDVPQLQQRLAGASPSQRDPQPISLTCTLSISCGLLVGCPSALLPAPFPSMVTHATRRPLASTSSNSATQRTTPAKASLTLCEPPPAQTPSFRLWNSGARSDKLCVSGVRASRGGMPYSCPEFRSSCGTAASTICTGHLHAQRGAACAVRLSTASRNVLVTALSCTDFDAIKRAGDILAQRYVNQARSSVPSTSASAAAIPFLHSVSLHSFHFDSSVQRHRQLVPTARSAENMQLGTSSSHSY